jgi:hypothetical protein
MDPETQAIDNDLKTAEKLILSASAGTRMWTMGQELWAILRFMKDQPYSREKGAPTLANIMKSSLPQIDAKNPNFVKLYEKYKGKATV